MRRPQLRRQNDRVDIEFLPLLLGSLIAAATIFPIELIGRLRAERARRTVTKPLPPLEEKIQLVATLSGQLSRLNSEIEDEFKLQKAEVGRLSAEADHARKVAALNQDALDAANAVAERQFGALLDSKSKSDRRFQIVVAIVSFGAGIFATLAIQWIQSLMAAAAGS